MRRLITTTALFATTAAFLFALFGCSHKLTGVPVGNKAPNTLLFVQGPVDTVNHLVHLYWFGSDDDGYVRGYETKMVNPEDTVAADSAWRYTTKLDTIVAVYTPAGHAKPTFYVRAIDNLGERDPHPAVETFLFRNRPPVVTWRFLPNHGDRSDTSFAAVTIGWNVSDPDGDLSLTKYRVWLDGRETTPDIVTGYLQYTVPSERFLVNGLWTTGPRTISVQAIDDGGMAGNIISTTWQVRSPVPNPDYTPGRRPGRLLIINNMLKDEPTYFMDSLYTNTATRNLPAGSWTIMRTGMFQPFKTQQDAIQTFNLYDAVVWFRGGTDSVATLIQTFQPALQSYLSTGGNLYIEGLYLVQGVNTPGALTQEFAMDYLDCNSESALRNYYRSSTHDSTGGWSNVLGPYVSTMFADTLTQQAMNTRYGSGGIRAFNVNSRSDIALMAAPASLSPAASDSMPVGVSVLQASGGRAVVISVPILRRNSGNGPRFLAKVFKQLGLIHS
jgi:hypothetical protein